MLLKYENKISSRRTKNFFPLKNGGIFFINKKEGAQDVRPNAPPGSQDANFAARFFLCRAFLSSKERNDDLLKKFFLTLKKISVAKNKKLFSFAENKKKFHCKNKQYFLFLFFLEKQVSRKPRKTKAGRTQYANFMRRPARRNKIIKKKKTTRKKFKFRKKFLDK